MLDISQSGIFDVWIWNFVFAETSLLTCKKGEKVPFKFYAIVGLHGWQPSESGNTYFTQEKTKKKKGDDHGDCSRTSFPVFDSECSTVRVRNRRICQIWPLRVSNRSYSG